MHTYMTRLTLRVALGVVALAGLMPAASAFAQMKPTDAMLKDRIEYRLDVAPAVKHYDLKVKVNMGIAMLSGTVATASQKSEAATIAKIDGISRVENDIKIDPNVDKSLGDKIKAGFSKTGEKIDDEWVTAKLKWKFHNEDLLDKSDISINTTKNVVTLKGTVKSEAGRVRANAVAQQTEGAKRVINNIVVVK